MNDARAQQIAQSLEAARIDTLRLFDLADEQHLAESPGFGFRPLIWHLAHIGVFEAYWVLQKLLGERPLDERYERIFDPISTPREQSRDLPSRAEIEAYLVRVRDRVLSYVSGLLYNVPDSELPANYVLQMVLQHEYQHQETLLYLLHLLDPTKKRHPGNGNSRSALGIRRLGLPHDMVVIPGGPFEMGSAGGAFAYDNELPGQEVDVPAFKIDRLLTTNEEYAEFIAEGGYGRREWWSDEGWECLKRERWTAPLYWKREGDAWASTRMFDEGPLAPDHPVAGISWYEAEAYARFRGKRLPREVEWEKAASWDRQRENKRRFSWGEESPSNSVCNFHNSFWGTTPVGAFPSGASSYGCLDMTGNVWEWTADAFDGFPGFAPFPYPEYSELWFDGDHRVLKGGSWATRAPILRTSFRNFFRRQFRIAFAGIRCAVDA